MYGCVSDVLAEKGRQVYTIRRGATVCDAVREMNRKGVGALVVVTGERLVGIFTERDVLRRIVDDDKDPAITRVVEVMTPDPVTVSPATRVADAMQLMTERRFRHVPVLEAGRLIGLVSIGDVMRWVTIRQQSDIEHMTDYITGRTP